MRSVSDIGALVPRIVFSVVLIGAACWIALSGTRFVRFHYLHNEIAAAEAVDPAAQPSPEDVAALRERLAGWRYTPGLGYVARIAYRDVGNMFIQPPLVAMAEAADVLAIDPVNGEAWMDLAQASRRDRNSGPLAMAAWQMSALATPREYPIMLRRIAFLMGMWKTAGAEQKRQFFFEADFLTNTLGPDFRAEWRRMLSYLPDDQRDTLEAEFRIYNPGYRR